MIMTKGSFDVLRSEIFKTLTQSHVDALNYLVKRCADSGCTYPETAYILATAFHETAGTMLPIKEQGSTAYLKGKKYYPYIGYGYVQLTWKENYIKVGELIGKDLVNHPELALETGIAATILISGMLHGWFTGVGLRKKRPVSRYNLAQYTAARNIVNGSDRALKIAKEAMVFEKALRT